MTSVIPILSVRAVRSVLSSRVTKDMNASLKQIPISPDGRHAAISIAAARVRRCGAAAGLGAHSKLPFARDLSWVPELSLGHDVADGSVLPLEDSSSAGQQGDHTTSSAPVSAGGANIDQY